MVHISELPDIDTDVGSLDESNVYHLLQIRFDHEALGKRSICGNLEGFSINSDNTEYEIMTLSKAESDGLRLCEMCKTYLKNHLDEDVKECSVCDRVSVLNTDEYVSIELDYGPHNGRSVALCESCIGRIKFNL